MQNTGVLLLSAGRRVALLRAFESALAARQLPAQVVAADAAPRYSAACALAKTACSLPRVGEPHYLAGLLDACERHGIGLVVPTLDPELLPLAQARDLLAQRGVQVAVGTPGAVSLFADKRRTLGFFGEHGVPTPPCYDATALRYPVFVKPVDGSNSQGLHVWPEASFCSEAVLHDRRNLFMAYLSPKRWAEYSVDAYYRGDGSLHACVPRQRLQVRGGEVSQARTSRNALVALMHDQLAFLPGVRGAMTLQFFFDGKTILGSEVNARFGGGYPLSHAAGVDFPGWLIDEYLLNCTLPPAKWRDGLLMLRYDMDVFV